MPRHFNPSIASWCQRLFNTKTGDHISSNIGDIIVPVMHIQPEANIVRSNNSATTGTFTVFTTPADKDFYLSTAIVTIQKDATADNSSVQLTCTKQGASRQLISFQTLSLTATTLTQSITFYPAVKIDRGTNIELTGAFTVGSLNRAGNITGYTVETATSQAN